MKPMHMLAHAVKMKMGKKMAKGGEVENEKLHPMDEPEHGAEMAVMKEMHLPLDEEEHDEGNMAHPKEMPGYTGHPDIAKAGDGEQMGFYAQGGMISPKEMVKHIMMKKMAAGGEVHEGEEIPLDESHDDFLSDEMQTPFESAANPEMKKKRMVSDILSKIKYKNLGVPHS